MRPSGMFIPRRDIEFLVRAMAQHYELPVEASFRQVDIYSQFEVVAIHGKGHGLMGISDDLAKKFKIKHKEWRDNVAGGLRIMAELRKLFDGDYARALGAYEIGIEPMRDLIAKYGPRWGNHLQPEVKELIERVVNDKKIERN